MTELAASNDISFFQAIIWCFYPIGALVFFELVLRALNDDDDDDFEGGKGVKISEPIPVPVGA
tara:strand:+ start:146 stop:334 length:189 start_codon:yes stop_codon:yes gene_type:complete